jgi:hypothetical protein
MGSIGVPEVMIVVVLTFFWAFPIAAAIWAIVALHRLQRGQEAIQQRLDAIARALPPPAA